MAAAETVDLLAHVGLEARASAPWPYATSHSLTSIVAVRPDGTELRLLHKRLDPGGVLPEAAGNRPPHIVDPRREIDAYRQVLPLLDGPPACLASSVDGLWLLLEHDEGRVLWQVGELEPWLAVASWLAGAHGALAAGVEAAPPSFLRYDAGYHARWVDRALAFESDPARHRRLSALVRSHRGIVDELLHGPPTVIHGECYPSNIVVAPGPGTTTRVCLVDWEMAAVGPGAVDLAALVTGWPAEQRTALIGAYAAAAGRHPEAVTAETAVAELHLCLRWLGWAPGWSPPGEHARDWLDRGLQLAEELGR